MSDLVVLLVLALTAASFAAGFKHAQGRPLWAWPMIGATVILAGLLRWTVVNFFRGAGTVGGAALSSSAGRLFGPRRVRRPESAELVERKIVSPNADPRGAEHGSWPFL